MTADVVQFLRARLDEDEQTARAAIHADGRLWQVSGSHADEGGTYWSIAAPTDGPSDVVELVGSGMSGGGVHTSEVAEHIARHDPARVLAEVDAKRQALTEYEDALTQRKKLAGTPHSIEGSVRVLTALRFVKLLALPYADHPEYPGERAL